MSGRIRTIKPEFPQSETIGKLSRDARLLFIQLWTLVDDEGRTRAPSRMLASLLYPYDDDAPGLIEDWLIELQTHKCVERYEVDGSSFLEICQWQKHQKIDHARASKIPSPREGSLILASPREASRKSAPDLDQGPRTKEEDQDSPSSSLRSDSSNPPADVDDEDEREPGKLKRRPTDGHVIQRICQIWNDSAATLGLTQVRDIPEARVKRIRQRVKDLRDVYGHEDPCAGFSVVIDKIRGSPFLRGETARGWKANLDWVTKSENFTKVMEDTYAAQNGSFGRH